MADLLQLQHVSKEFGGGIFSRSNITLALDNVTFGIPGDRPTITAVAGESGSGKTTLARLMLGVLEPTSGSVLYQGIDIRRMSRADRMQYRREVQPIFQDPFEAYNPFYTIDHVLHRPIRNFHVADDRSTRQERIEEALRMVGLQPEETLGRYPHQLSGGQRQRVMVARALILRPRVILADEPVSMVDASLRATILRSIRDLNRMHGITVVYITHDLTTAYQMCDNIVVMYRGAVVEAGSVDEVIKNPKHPYTQLLIDSVPQPDPKTTWGDDEVHSERIDEGGMHSESCNFADRCPMAMPQCSESAPPLYKLSTHQLARCFLHDEYDADPDPDIGNSFSYRNTTQQPEPTATT